MDGLRKYTILVLLWSLLSAVVYSETLDPPFRDVPMKKRSVESEYESRSEPKIRKVRRVRRKRRRPRRVKRRRVQSEAEAESETSESGDDEAVDLSAMDNESETEAKASDPHHPRNTNNPHNPANRQAGGEGGQFKLFFDIVLNYRPGINPLTFDNYHTAFLVDYIPNPDLQFSVGVAPPLIVPRFYELDYNISRRVQLRVGRIWIPFDQINPHNTFGGLWNTSTLRADNQEAFLPDIWADLGIGVKFSLAESSNLNVNAHLYVVNGFQSGGTDPLAESTSYPDFETLPNGADNNTDKAFGGRIHMDVANVFGLGASVYSGAYSDEGTQANRILMLGADTQIRPTKSTELRAGYALMNVDLKGGITRQSYLRGGLYGELRQRIGRQWQLVARGGLTQNDNAVSDRNDRTLVGGRIEWRATPNLALIAEHHRDINPTPDKINLSYSALRLSILF
ncbi:MAG: hypothetical protein KDD51_13945 [Bdellovibrionales bacterium]|nr:hypothetical protein [Bdellovibrionales bacterium]